MIPIKAIGQLIIRYVNPGAGGNLTRLKKDLDARWGTQLAKAKQAIMQTEGIGLNVGSDSTGVATKDSTGVTTKDSTFVKPDTTKSIKDYVNNLNSPIKSDSTSKSLVKIDPGN
jgi:hypothetical protein